MIKYWLPNGVYDAIKFFVTTVLPALSVAYVGFAGIWGWPYADEVSRTIAVVYTLFCSIMGISGALAKRIDDTSVLWDE